MSVVGSLQEWSFFIGPLLLLLAGWLSNYLRNRGGTWKQDNLFFGTELAFSGIGSVLGAFASITGTVDSPRVILLVTLLILDILILVIVTSLHRAFDSKSKRPKLRLFMLALVANGLPLASLTFTLYASKWPAG